MSDVFVSVKNGELSEVKEIYTKYYRGKWYYSDTPQAGYTKEYYATKVKQRMYFSTREDAEERANKYNKRYLAWKYGKKADMPERITWAQVKGSEITNDKIWPHDTESWHYNHAEVPDWSYWTTENLLKGDISYMEADGHSTKEFLETVFDFVPDFTSYKIRKIGTETTTSTVLTTKGWQKVETTVDKYGVFLR